MWSSGRPLPREGIRIIPNPKPHDLSAIVARKFAMKLREHSGLFIVVPAQAGTHRATPHVPKDGSRLSPG